MLEPHSTLDVADVLLLPQLTHNVVFAIRKACARTHASCRRQRSRRAVWSPCSRRRAGPARPRRRHEPRGDAREERGQANAAPRPRPAVRRRGDHARPRAGEDDLRPRRRSGRARLGEARGLRHAASVRARRPRRAAPARGRRARRREQGDRACSTSRARRTTRSSSTPRRSSTGDAGDARPHRRADRALRARRADAQERAARRCRRSSSCRSRPAGSRTS